MTSHSEFSSEARRSHEPLGRRARGPFPDGEDELALIEHGVDRSRYADALREELVAVAHRRRQLRAYARDGTRDIDAPDATLRRAPTDEAGASIQPGWRRWVEPTWATLRRLPGAFAELIRKHAYGRAVDAPCEVSREEDETFRLARCSLAGLALSGGGIRSATFALGALQGLAARGVLGAFDFCSTVSGGGFTGGWWSAWLSRPGWKPSDGIFPPDERLEPDRYPAALLHNARGRGADSGSQAEVAKVPDGSRSVRQHDPIHHLRLFSNYLTPRSGALSSDTWRAVTIIARNVVLTWLILLPVLLAVVLGSQLYFAGRHDVGYGFACSRPDSLRRIARPGLPDSLVPVPRQAGSVFCRQALETAKTLSAASATGATGNSQEQIDAAGHTVQSASSLHGAVLGKRIDVLVQPAISGLILSVGFTLLWMLYSSQSIWWTASSFAGIGWLLWILLDPRSAAGPASCNAASTCDSLWCEFRCDRWWIPTLSALLAMIALLGFGPLVREAWVTAAARTLGRMRATGVPRDAVRNTIVRWHVRAVMLYVVILVMLALAGFGHELVWYLFEPEGGRLSVAARRAGGWIAFLAVAVSALTTLVKSFPSPKGHDAAAQEPSRVTRIAMAIAPLLTVFALAIACAWFGHWILGSRTEWSATGYDEASAAARALTAAVVILLAFSVFESLARRGKLNGVGEITIRGGQAVLVLTALGALLFWRSNPSNNVGQAISYTLLSLSIAVLVLRYSDAGKTKLRNTAALAIGVAGAVVTQWWLTGFMNARTGDGSSRTVFTMSLVLLVGLTLLLLVDWVLRDRMNQRSTTLATLALAGSFALVLLHHLPHQLPAVGLGTTGVGWTAFLIAWVVGLGWTIDPNLVSLHNFYKGRIVRAYLGASNVDERLDREITEAARDDDIPLKNLANHCRGAPLHLINTTLNLVGGRDLATAQRSAAPFTLSSQVCGSGRTGYRRTAEYMGGTLSLGTAVAASGAAVSPTMGAKSVNASLALLLALFNVRLGFWAPTPNKGRWRERQPTLWPFYLLSEALSQTNDLGSYCYLTDGGHFDNTGVYALVERGCRYIYVLDDGADPKPCFSDMGDLLRRCRIDFGAEIDLADGVAVFAQDRVSRLATAHVVRGTITYSPAHLRMLGWSETEIAAGTTGFILWVKPAVTKDDSVDLRQYHLENTDFPQQTTVDQWYDESQFESYRALGYLSVSSWLKALGGGVVATDPGTLFPQPAAPIR
jgi:hypothetical protein